MTNWIRPLTTLFILVLALYAVTGFFVRPEADDLHFIDLAQNGGVMAQQYNSWHGRYGYTLLMGMYMPLAPTPVVQTFPALLIVGMVVVLWQLLKRAVDHPLFAASGLVLAFIIALPDMWQSLYWYGGSTNYIFPLIALGAIMLWLLR